jgi:aryl-alcohol dehydrogenase-like predicted oxidoreductase
MEVDGLPDGFPDPGREHVIRLIQECHDLGINLIDTAEIYGNGEGERRIGDALRGRRDEWVVVTKFGLRRGPNATRIRDASPGAITDSLEGSLRRLGTDYVDVYLYHTPPGKNQVCAGLETLGRLREQGKLRFCGISTNDSSILRSLAQFKAMEVVMFSQSLLTHPEDTLELVRRHDLGSLVRGAFEHGWLTGKYFQMAPRFSGEDIRSHALKETDFTRYSACEQLVPAGGDMICLALRYLLDFHTTHTIVLGAKSAEDYRRALGALKLPVLGEDVQARIRMIRHQFNVADSKGRVRVSGALRRLAGLVTAGLRSVIAHR